MVMYATASTRTYSYTGRGHKTILALCFARCASWDSVTQGKQYCSIGLFGFFPPNEHKCSNPYRLRGPLYPGLSCSSKFSFILRSSALPHTCSSHLILKVSAQYVKRGGYLRTEISLSWATSSATCPRAWRSSWDSRASLSFILFSVRIISSFSNVFVSHSRSFLSSLLTSSMCSGMGVGQERKWEETIEYVWVYL